MPCSARSSGRCHNNPAASQSRYASSVIVKNERAVQTIGKKGGPDNAIGRSRGGLSTKINAAVDQAGMPIGIVLSQGQASDKTIAPVLIEQLEPGRDLIADRGYDARPYRSGRTPRRPSSHPDLS